MGMGRQKVFLAFVLRLSCTSRPRCWEPVPGVLHLQGETLLGSAACVGQDFIEGERPEAPAWPIPILRMEGCRVLPWGSSPLSHGGREEIF